MPVINLIKMAQLAPVLDQLKIQLHNNLSVLPVKLLYPFPFNGPSFCDWREYENTHLVMYYYIILTWNKANQALLN